MSVRQASPTTSVVPPAVLDADVVVEDDRWRQIDDCDACVLAAVSGLVAARPEGLPGGASAVSIVLSDDARVTQLNLAYRGKAAPTNVLSFPAGPGATEPGAPAYLGDVILAFETLEREAGTFAVPLAHHLQHLVVHGLLHLVGHDHIEDRDAEIMEAIERRVLATLGVADPYEAPLDGIAPASTGSSSDAPQNRP